MLNIEMLQVTLVNKVHIKRSDNSNNNNSNNNICCGHPLSKRNKKKTKKTFKKGKRKHRINSVIERERNGMKRNNVKH